MLQDSRYQAAFLAYLRKGIPIARSLKEARETERYVWRTRHDGKVRPAHARNDGHVFYWSDPPETGHPGEDYNCRCQATPYVEGQTEFANFEFSTGLASSYDRWTDRDFVYHYYFGEGRPVTLLEIGHLREIAEHYAYVVNGGVFRRLAGQIASEARKQKEDLLVYDFGWHYDFGDVEFSYGDSVVSGAFNGSVRGLGEMLVISGKTDFHFSDRFEDPVSLHIELGGTPYEITGEWSATFEAQIFRDEARSEYFRKKAE